MQFRSRKYGNLEGWRPDRRMLINVDLFYRKSLIVLLALVFHNVSEASDRPYSHVVLTTKAIPELQRTPELLAPLLSAPYATVNPQPTYVIMQNGLGVERDLYDALKKLNPEEEPRIISTAVWIGTRLIDKNVVEHNEFVSSALNICQRKGPGV